MSTFDKVKEVIIDKLGVEEDSIKSEAHLQHIILFSKLQMVCL